MESAQRPRSARGRGIGRGVVVALLVALTVELSGLGARVARADAPPADAGAALDASAAADARVDAGAPAPTTPETTAAPVTPVAPSGSAAAPTLTPDLPVVAAPALDRPSPAGPAPRGKPFYRKDWFWGAIGVAVLTATIILAATSGSSSDAPTTTLGNMRAF